MSEDIINRLRCIYVDGGCGQCTFCLAGAEIEQLREDLNTTQELLARCYRMAVGHGPNFDVFDTWEEAISAYERETHRG